MNILITGVNGFVGRYLSKSWRKEHRIIGIDINKTFNEDVECIYDLNHLDKPLDSDVIIHLAGKAQDSTINVDFNSYFEANTKLTKIVFDSFLQSSARKFIFFSSVKAVVDQFPDGILTEDINPCPIGPYGISKLKAENYLLSKFDEARIKGKSVFLLRPCMIHGPGSKGNLKLLYNVVNRRIPWPFGAYDNLRSFCSIENLLFVLNRMILNDELKSGVFNVCDDTPISTNGIIQIISEEINKNAIVLRFPKILVDNIFSIGGVVNLPFNKNMLLKVTGNYIASNQKIKNALEIATMPVSAVDGMRVAIRSFHEN
jgi:nucleoside-diphosphate-sugar epimerase